MRMHVKKLRALAILLCLSSSLQIWAATYTWTGSGTPPDNTLWTNPANWSSSDGGTTYPGPDDTARIATDSANIIIPALPEATPGSYQIGTINVSAKKVKLTLQDDLTIGNVTTPINSILEADALTIDINNNVLFINYFHIGDGGNYADSYVKVQNGNFTINTLDLSDNADSTLDLINVDMQILVHYYVNFRDDSKKFTLKGTGSTLDASNASGGTYSNIDHLIAGLANGASAGGEVPAITTNTKSYIWTGAVDSDWTNTANWLDSENNSVTNPPASDISVTIPQGLTNYPALAGGIQALTLTLEDGAQITSTSAAEIQVSIEIQNNGEISGDNIEIKTKKFKSAGGSTTVKKLTAPQTTLTQASVTTAEPQTYTNLTVNTSAELKSTGADGKIEISALNGSGNLSIENTNDSFLNFVPPAQIPHNLELKGNIRPSADLNVNANLTVKTGYLNMDTKNVSVAENLVIETGAKFNEGGNLTVEKDFTNSGSFLGTNTSSTVDIGGNLNDGDGNWTHTGILNLNGEDKTFTAKAANTYPTVNVNSETTIKNTLTVTTLTVNADTTAENSLKVANLTVDSGITLQAQNLEVATSIANGGTITLTGDLKSTSPAAIDGTVKFTGNGTSEITEFSTFDNLLIEPSTEKTIKFPSGSANAITVSGDFTVTGASQSQKVTLTASGSPTDDDDSSWWHLASAVTPSFTNANIGYAKATSDMSTYLDDTCTEIFGTSKFTTINWFSEHKWYWFGKNDTSWDTLGNWSAVEDGSSFINARPPKTESDTVIIVKSSAPNELILEADITVKSLEVATGAEINFDTFNVNAITLTNSGTLSAGSSTVTLSETFENTGTFTADTSSFVFIGDDISISDAIEFYNATFSGNNVELSGNCAFNEATFSGDNANLSGNNTFSSNATFSGDNANLSGDNTFSAETTFSGANVTLSGDNTFTSKAEFSGNGAILISGENTFETLSFTGAGATVKFGASKTQTVGTFKSVGTSGNKITLTTDSLAPDTSDEATWWIIDIEKDSWKVSPTNPDPSKFEYTTIEFTKSVRNIFHSWGTGVAEGEENTTINWFSAYYHWIGGEDTSWKNHKNWAQGGIDDDISDLVELIDETHLPKATDDIVIRAGGKTPTLVETDAPVKMRNLTVSENAILCLGKLPKDSFIVTYDISNSGSIDLGETEDQNIQAETIKNESTGKIYVHSNGAKLSVANTINTTFLENGEIVYGAISDLYTPDTFEISSFLQYNHDDGTSGSSYRDYPYNNLTIAKNTTIKAGFATSADLPVLAVKDTLKIDGKIEYNDKNFLEITLDTAGTLTYGEDSEIIFSNAGNSNQTGEDDSDYEITVPEVYTKIQNLTISGFTCKFENECEITGNFTLDGGLALVNADVQAGTGPDASATIKDLSASAGTTYPSLTINDAKTLTLHKTVKIIGNTTITGNDTGKLVLDEANIQEDGGNFELLINSHVDFTSSSVEVKKLTLNNTSDDKTFTFTGENTVTGKEETIIKGQLKATDSAASVSLGGKKADIKEADFATVAPILVFIGGENQNFYPSEKLAGTEPVTHPEIKLQKTAGTVTIPSDAAEKITAKKITVGEDSTFVAADKYFTFTDGFENSGTVTITGTPPEVTIKIDGDFINKKTAGIKGKITCKNFENENSGTVTITSVIANKNFMNEGKVKIDDLIVDGNFTPGKNNSESVYTKVTLTGADCADSKIIITGDTDVGDTATKIKKLICENAGDKTLELNGNLYIDEISLSGSENHYLTITSDTASKGEIYKEGNQNDAGNWLHFPNNEYPEVAKKNGKTMGFFFISNSTHAENTSFPRGWGPKGRFTWIGKDSSEWDLDSNWEPTNPVDIGSEGIEIIVGGKDSYTHRLEYNYSESPNIKSFTLRGDGEIIFEDGTLSATTFEIINDNSGNVGSITINDATLTLSNLKNEGKLTTSGTISFDKSLSEDGSFTLKGGKFIYNGTSNTTFTNPFAFEKNTETETYFEAKDYVNIELPAATFSEKPDITLSGNFTLPKAVIGKFAQKNGTVKFVDFAQAEKPLETLEADSIEASGKSIIAKALALHGNISGSNVRIFADVTLDKSANFTTSSAASIPESTILITGNLSVNGTGEESLNIAENRILKIERPAQSSGATSPTSFKISNFTLASPGIWYLDIGDTRNPNSFISTAENCSIGGGIVRCYDFTNEAYDDGTVQIPCMNCTPLETGEKNWNFDDFEIAEAATISDRIIRITFNTDSNGRKIKLRNHDALVSGNIADLTYTGGSFTGIYSDSECKVSLSESYFEGANVIYLKAPDSETWNTDAYSSSSSDTEYPGGEKSTDSNGEHKSNIPILTVAENRFVNEWGKTFKGNLNEIFTYKNIADNTRPVLINVRTGQELHKAYDKTIGADSQNSYDGHNFIEFIYSEPVNLEVGEETKLLAWKDENNTEPNTIENIKSTETVGAITNVKGGGLNISAFAKFEKGELVTGSEGKADTTVHALYRNDIYSLRLSIAGYTNGTIEDNEGNLFKKWTGYIDHAKTPSGKVSLPEGGIKFIKDLSPAQNECASIKPNLYVDNTEVALYGIWDTSKPSFAPLRTNKTKWGDFTYNEAVGTNTNGTAVLDRIEFHVFDNTPVYDGNESPQWYTGLGWGTDERTLFDKTYTYATDITGGSKQFNSDSKHRTSGGIRYSSLHNATSSFTYKIKDSDTVKEFDSSVAVYYGGNASLFNSKSYPTHTATSPDTLYFGLKLSDTDLPIRTMFKVSYNAEKSYITDLAGNRLLSAEITTVDMIPPSFALSLAPVGHSKVFILLVKKLNLDSNLTVFENDGGYSYHDPKKALSEAFEIVSIDENGNAQISQDLFVDKSVPPEITIQKENYTGFYLTLNRNITFEDNLKYYIRAKNQPTSIDPITGIVNSNVTLVQDDIGNYLGMYEAHFVSDFLIDGAAPLYAYDTNMTTSAENAMQNLYEENSWAVHDWNSDQKNYGTLPADDPIRIVADKLAVENMNLRIFLSEKPDLNSVFDNYNDICDAETRIWIPDTEYGLLPSFASNTNKHFLSVTGTPLENSPDLIAFDISKDMVSTWKNGDQVSFLFALCNPDNSLFTAYHSPVYDNENGIYNLSVSDRFPLFAIRLENPDDLKTLDLWSFKIKEVKNQRGGVTILNNVINVSKGEKTVIKLDTAQSGKVDVIVMTLDGNIIEYLNRGELEAGTHYFTWNGTNRSGKKVARGMYFVRVIGSGYDETRKVMVTK